jgi:hypothetical protein
MSSQLEPQAASPPPPSAALTVEATAAAAVNHIIEIDPEPTHDSDKGYQIDWLSTGTTSISSSAPDYIFKNSC